jgi:hypothetical protein
MEWANPLCLDLFASLFKGVFDWPRAHNVPSFAWARTGHLSTILYTDVSNGNTLQGQVL